MDTLQFFGYLGALILGVLLGLLGSGGSIMAVPIFTYLFQISPVTTTAYSLFVVGTSASVGAIQNLKSGLIDFKIALIFAIPAFTSVYVVRKFLLPIVPEELLSIGASTLTKDRAIMLFFALLMVVASISMLIKRKDQKTEDYETKYNYPLIVMQGTLIGVLTGIVGIGGGFLIVPALVILVKLPLNKAVTTSLFIIALKSLIGFVGDLGNLEINWSFLLSFTIVSVFGIFIGVHFSSYVKADRLKTTYGWFVLAVATVIIFEQLI